MGFTISSSDSIHKENGGAAKQQRLEPEIELLMKEMCLVEARQEKKYTTAEVEAMLKRPELWINKLS